MCEWEKSNCSRIFNRLIKYLSILDEGYLTVAWVSVLSLAAAHVIFASCDARSVCLKAADSDTSRSGISMREKERERVLSAHFPLEGNSNASKNTIY